MKIVKPAIATATWSRTMVDEDIWGGRIALQYQLSAQTMVYGLISRGYKAGGVNSDASLSAEDREFDTELMLNYEWRAQRGAGWTIALQAQVALFYQQRDDIQIKQTLVEPRADRKWIDLYRLFRQFSEGSNYGVELEFNWLATETLALFGSLGLLETEYDIPLSEILTAVSKPMHRPINLH